MPPVEERSRERRWIIIAASGQYVTMGRHSDPTLEELQEAEEALRAQGKSGWLAVMDGNPYVGPLPTLMMVRPLADPAEPWEEAVAAYQRQWREKRER